MNFTKATRSNVPLLIGIAGPSGSGKTLSALRLAKGLAGGRAIAFIDTERGRGLHYADDFDFLHAELDAPFSPEHYGEALREAVAQNPAVIVVDSFSHEHAGEGGVLDGHEAELQRMAGDDYRKRESMKFSAWIKPKAAHKRLVAQLLQLPVHLIVCLRAEEKIDLVKKDGKLVVKPKRTLSGHVGWIPICGKDLPYELTISLVVTPDKPGVPVPIKLQEQHRELVPLDRPLDEETGSRLAAWAKGSGAEPSPTAALAAEDAGGRSGTEPAPSAPVTTGASFPQETPQSPPSGAPAHGSDVKPTPGQKKKIGVHIATLRDGVGAVTTEQLWANIARSRGVEADVMIALLCGKDDAGVLHFGPLLADLNRAEASRLIDWFERVEASLPKAAA